MKSQLRLLLAGATVVGVVAGLSGSAQAQTTPQTIKVQKPFRVKIGAFFPTDGDLRDAVGSTFFSYGLSYDFGKSTATNPAIYSVYYDGNTKSEHGNNVNYNSVGAQIRFSLTPAVAATRFYAGAGLGAYFIHASGGGDSDNFTRFGGKVLGGVEFNAGLFAEADYTIVSDIRGTSPNGFNLSVGYRF